MRHFYIVCALVLLILPNCGKKDSSVKKKKIKKIASIDNEVKDSVNSLLASNENKTGENNISSDFSFIDEDNSFVEKDMEKLASTKSDDNEKNEDDFYKEEDSTLFSESNKEAVPKENTLPL